MAAPWRGQLPAQKSAQSHKELRHTSLENQTKFESLRRSLASAVSSTRPTKRYQYRSNTFSYFGCFGSKKNKRGFKNPSFGKTTSKHNLLLPIPGQTHPHISQKSVNNFLINTPASTTVIAFSNWFNQRSVPELVLQKENVWRYLVQAVNNRLIPSRYWIAFDRPVHWMMSPPRAK